jgi:uncharacterized protein involved in exopolysaccharide biosynthesis
MTQDRFQSEKPPVTESAGHVGGWGVFAVLVKNRHALIWYPLAVAVVIALFALVVPEYYQAKVTVLPPDRDFQTISLSSMALSQFGLGGAGGMALPLMATPSDILAEVLTSRRVLSAVVDSLHLDSLWQIPARHAAMERLREAVTVDVGLTGIVNIGVTDHSPERAALVANTLVGCADAINRGIVNTRARNTRMFIGRRLEETQQALAAAAADLECFQREHGTISLDDELTAVIQNIAALDAQLTADEIELSALKQNMSSRNPQVAALEVRVGETRRRLQQLESGTDSTRLFLQTGLQGVPLLALRLAEKIRSVKIEETLLELLSAQHESARIQETQDTPTFSILDYADASSPRSQPRRVRLVLASYATSLAMVIALSFAGEYFVVMRRKEPEKYEFIMSALTVLRRDWLGLRRRK